MGDLFGKAQSGDAPFRVADLLRDEGLNERARVVALRLLQDDPELTSDQHAGIRAVLTSRYARSLDLFRVG
jgi:ATP-dependent DNA helicase RecG